ncbi:unnamed protein product [Moneuplotes crassus]|uniref:Uncharacterized protein n=1 Tax=Euplotes crassus TaxID=5936 RepID=A0AAD1XDS4_EUPCR|nr:unnamed protein product [Moneuplotes crassus]
MGTYKETQGLCPSKIDLLWKNSTKIGYVPESYKPKSKQVVVVKWTKTVPKMDRCVKNKDDEDTAVKTSPKIETLMKGRPPLSKKKLSSVSQEPEQASEPTISKSKVPLSKSKSLISASQVEALEEPVKKRGRKAKKKSEDESKNLNEIIEPVSNRKRQRAKRTVYQKMIYFKIKLPKCEATREELKNFKRRKYQEEAVKPKTIFHPKKGYAIRSKTPIVFS